MTLENIVYAVLFMFVGLIILSYLRPTRHTLNIKKSKKIQKKINTFDNDGKKINYLRKIDPFVFEEMLLTAYRKKGFKIKRNRRYTGDNGVDGKIFKENHQFLIQAKRYGSYINQRHLEDFSKVIIKEKAAGGFFIHTGKTSTDTMKIAKRLNIEVVSGSELIRLLNF